MRRKAPLRTVVERIGRHAVRLSCGHVEQLSSGEADSIGRVMPCFECQDAAEESEGEEPA